MRPAAPVFVSRLTAAAQKKRGPTRAGPRILQTIRLRNSCDLQNSAEFDKTVHTVIFAIGNRTLDLYTVRGLALLLKWEVGVCSLIRLTLPRWIMVGHPASSGLPLRLRSRDTQIIYPRAMSRNECESHISKGHISTFLQEVENAASTPSAFGWPGLKYSTTGRRLRSPGRS